MSRRKLSKKKYTKMEISTEMEAEETFARYLQTGKPGALTQKEIMAKTKIRFLLKILVPDDKISN